MRASPATGATAFAAAPQPLVRRLVNKTDFERLLAVRPCCRSAHFALHHVGGRPAALPVRASQPAAADLSTSVDPEPDEPVDISGCGWWFAAVLPKRHARRAVTRNLLKRLARGAFGRHAAQLPAGLWLLRLREPFARQQFVSARSSALTDASRAELEALFVQAAA